MICPHPETESPIRPQDILKLLAMFRWVMPTKIIGLFGGRERNLREWQPKMFMAGANSMLVGNYLTTTGNPVDLDWQLIEQAGRVPMSAENKAGADSAKYH